MIERDNKITLDIDKDRIKEIVRESFRIIEDYSGGAFTMDKAVVLSKLDSLLDSNLISTEFFLMIPLDKIPDLRLRVDPRRRKLLCKSSFKKKVAKMNHFIKVL